MSWTVGELDCRRVGCRNVGELVCRRVVQLPMKLNVGLVFSITPKLLSQSVKEYLCSHQCFFSINESKIFVNDNISFSLTITKTKITMPTSRYP